MAAFAGGAAKRRGNAQPHAERPTLDTTVA